MKAMLDDVPDVSGVLGYIILVHRLRQVFVHKSINLSVKRHDKDFQRNLNDENDAHDSAEGLEQTRVCLTSAPGAHCRNDKYTDARQDQDYRNGKEAVLQHFFGRQKVTTDADEAER